MQPSAQGIASLFMGNPGALAARVDQDRKSSPMGIPDDLRQLMALNIVTTENDAAKRQQALAQLQQMSPMGGQPPTVADSVRAQAQQKIQARMAQEMQKQQAMQQMMGGLPAAGIPEGVPQPERQPEVQGIDQVPVEFGMASGGIVAFQAGGRGEKEPLDETARRDREALAKIAQAIKEENVMAGSAIADILSMIPRGLAGAYDTAVVRPMRAMGVNAAYLSPKLTPEGADVESMTPFADIQRAKRTQQAPSVLASEPSAQPEIIGSEVENLRRRAEAQMQERGRQAQPRPIATARPSAGITAALQQPTQPSQPVPAEAPADQGGLSYQGVLNQAAADRALREAEYERRIGRPDRTQLDRLMAEYERQKEAAQGPQAGFGALAEYLAQIAATPRGMTSFEAGAAGARGVQALQKERAATRAALTEKQIGLEREQMKAERDYAKEVFGVGDKEYDRAFKANMDLFLEQGRNKRQAETMAHEKTMADVKFQNDVKLAKIRADYDAGIKAMPGSEERMRDKAIAAYKKDHPTASDFEAMQALGITGSTGRGATPTDMLRAAQTMLEQATTDEERNAALGTIKRIMGQQTAQPTSVPAAAIQALRQNPSLAAQFDQKYGKGAAAQYLQK